MSKNETMFFLKKELYGPFLWMGFSCLKARARNSWYSFYRPRKDERLSLPWSHPVVLNTGPLDLESSALTTRPLLHFHCKSFLQHYKNGILKST